MSTVPAETMPLTGNGATADAYLDQKIDPSIGQAISHGNEGEVAPSHATSYPNGTVNGAAPTSDVVPLEAPNGLSGGAPSSVPETSAPAAEVPTTTTTTIITTTTGPASNGSGIASPTSPTAPTSELASTSPTATGANGSAIAPAAAGAAGAADGAAVAEKAAEKKAAAPPKTMSAKDAKKYNKLLQSEAKNEEKEIAAAIKTAQSNEKALRKAKKAERQSGGRHDSAVKDEHNASKSLNKAKLAHEKAASALQKAEEELEIKKRHTATHNEAYESIKAKIESLRKNKLANEKDRQSRMATVV